MGRSCSICIHESRTEIEQELLDPEKSFRAISHHWRVSRDSLRRHKLAKHISDEMVEAASTVQTMRSQDLLAEFERILRRLIMLSHACHDQLVDPENPDRYSLEPRAEDVQVVYVDTSNPKRTKRRKASLSALLALAGGDSGGIEVDVQVVEVKRPDAADLLLKTAARLESPIGMLMELADKVQEKRDVEAEAEEEDAQAFDADRLSKAENAQLYELIAAGEGKRKKEGSLLTLRCGCGLPWAPEAVCKGCGETVHLTCTGCGTAVAPSLARELSE